MQKKKTGPKRINRRALFRAAEQGNIRVIDLFLRRGGDICIKYGEKTLTGVAADSNRLKLVDFLRRKLAIRNAKFAK